MAKSTKRQELEREYKKLADRANHRLAELEKLSKNPEYENVLSYAYKVAAKQTSQYNSRIKSEKVRYRVPKNTNQLEAALNDVKDFLNMPTSTKKGINKVYKEGAENFNKSFGTNFTWQEVANFTEKVDFEDLKKTYGSPVLVMVIRSMKSHKVSASDIRRFNETHKTMTGDEIEDELINRLWKEGITANKLKGSGEFQKLTDYDFSPFN